MLEKRITFDSFIRGILSGGIIFGILYLVNYLSSVLLPFFVAWLIAYMIYPMVTFVQYKLKLKNRVASILVVLLALIIFITLSVTLLIPPFIEEFSKLKELLSDYLIAGSQKAAIPGTIENLVKEYMTEFKDSLNDVNITQAIKSLLPKAWTLLSQSLSLIASIFAAFIVILYMFFILLDYESIASGWINLVPKKYRETTNRIVTDVKESMNRYFRGQALVAFSVGILFSIGFLIIDFPLAIGFGLFIGLLNMVPYLQLVALVPTVLLALLKAADTGGNFWIIFASAVAVFCIVQVINDMIVVPKVMGKAMGMNPALLLLSLSVWGTLLGFIGLIIALPLTTIIMAYWKRYVSGDVSLEPGQKSDHPNVK